MHINCPFSFIFSLTGMDREFIKRIKEKNVFFVGGLCICNVLFLDDELSACELFT